MAISIIFYVHPYLGKIPKLTNIFQSGLIHQLALLLARAGSNVETAKRHADAECRKLQRQLKVTFLFFFTDWMHTGVMKWDPCWGDQTMQMYGDFVGFPL